MCRIIGCFPPLEIYIESSGSMEASLKEGGFQFRSRLGSVILFFLIGMVSSITEIYLQPLRGNKVQQQCLYYFGSLLDTSDQQVEGDFACLVLGTKLSPQCHI